MLTFILTLVTVVIASILYSLALLRSSYMQLSKDGAGPPPRHICKEPFYGTDFTLSHVRKLQDMMGYFHRLGHTFTIIVLRRSPRIYTISPENIRTILTETHIWGVAPLRQETMEEAFGHGFANSDGKAALLAKKYLKTTFAKFRPRHFDIFAREVARFTECLPDDGSEIDIQPLIFRIFFNGSLHYLLGIDPDRGAAGAPCSVSEFEKAWGSVMLTMGIRHFSPLLAMILPNGKYRNGLKVFHSFLDYYIEQALLRRSSQVDTSSDEKQRSSTDDETDKRTSVLDDLVMQTSDPLVLRSLIAQSLLASNNTTSWAVSNTLFLLARHPEIWSELRDEALVTSEQNHLPDALSESSCYRNVIQESLRLYPIFPRLPRAALQNTSLPLGGGREGTSPIAIPKSSVALCDSFILHRDPRVYGANAEEFDPKRWDHIQPGRGEYVPFSIGSRACMGEQKARLEMTYIVAQMARRFTRLQSHDETNFRADIKGSCKNANGCWVALRR